jgi:hypothetical protein
MQFRFIPHVIDTSLPVDYYAQTALVDLDNDGVLEYVVGQREGDVFWFKYHAPDRWTRHLLGTGSPSDVGGCALDVDGDGWVDFVAGGAWYRNSRQADVPFERIVFDAELSSVHDLFPADIDGDGRAEIVSMSDRNSLRWYKIPPDPAQPWPMTEVGPAVHAGAAAGDLNGNGHLDLVRTDMWYENARGDGTLWIAHPIGPNTPPPPDFQPYFAFNATHAAVRDVNRSGANDIVYTDAEIPGGKVWWMENVSGDGEAWARHEIYDWDSSTPRRGAYHSLYAGDLDGDGDVDVLSCEMEAVGGEAPPRWYIWENVDGLGDAWQEHVIFDGNLGGHAAAVGDVTGNGLPDVIAKPWRAQPGNAVEGKMYVVFLENVSE